MSNLILGAAKGQRKAMEQLYEANKQKAYYVAKCLLGKNSMATEAAYFAFKNVWSGIAAHGITTEEEFIHLVIRKTVDYCKKKVGKSDEKAFRIPRNRNFLIASDSTIAKDCKNIGEEVLCKLPALQRFIFVLHTVGDYLPEQIASTFKFDMKTVSVALDAEKTNVERITKHLDNKYSFEAILKNIRDAEENVDVPNVLDERVGAVINNIATPIEKKKKKQITVIAVSVLVGVLLIVGIVLLATCDTTGTASTSGDDTSTSDTATYSTADTTVISEPVIELDEALTYYADIEIADYGTITVELDREAAPVTVSNFVNLAQNGFYDGLTFHRIIEGFMMQGGDPNGDGTGGNTDEDGNEVNIVGEFTDNGYENSLSHTRGAISMARATEYNSASSQFFIVHEDSSSSLDGQYAVFGYVTEGLDIVDSVCESAEPTDDNGTVAADAQPVITSITIRTE